jgi:putative ABC transport system substrate-binding protein
VPLWANAQDAARVYRIGVLTELSEQRAELWRDVLQKRGYLEGQNAIFVFRAAEEKFDLLPKLATELIQERVDIILTYSTPPAVIAKRVTTTIPIVTISSDPVGAGLVRSLASPGGNVTGVFVPLTELAAKRLQLLKEAVPGLGSVGILWNPNNPPARLQAEAAEAAARSLGIRTHFLEARTHGDLNGVVEILSARRVGGLVVMQDPIMFAASRDLAALCTRHRVPASHAYREFVDAGGLMSYGFTMTGLFEAAAEYADRILKGAKASDLPMEQPTRFEMVINLRTAKALRLEVPESLLVRADEVLR